MLGAIGYHDRAHPRAHDMFRTLRSLQGNPLIQVLALAAFLLNVTYCATHIAIDHVLLGNSLVHVDEDGERHHGEEHDHDHRQPVEETSHSVKDHIPALVFPRDRFEVEDGFAQVGRVAPERDLLWSVCLAGISSAPPEPRNLGFLDSPSVPLRGPPHLS